MPAIKAGTLQGRDIEGADYGATISLILSECEPGEGPRTPPASARHFGHSYGVPPARYRRNYRATA